MNKILFAFLLTVCGYIPAHAAINKFLPERTGRECRSSDTTDKRKAEFQTFSDQYFGAVRKGDTAFLRVHTLFPINSSSFDVLDRSLHGVKITSAILFRKLHKLFPADYMEDIRSIAEYHVVHARNEEEYVVECSYDDGGVDSNVKWIFVKKNGQYYFYTYVAEAG